MSLEIKVPAPGESVSEVTIANWLKKEGEWVEMDEPIAEMESDKATFEVNAEKSGIIEKLNGAVGDTIAVGSVVAVINTDAQKPAGTAIKENSANAKTENPKAEQAVPKIVEVAAATNYSDLHISPVAAKLIAEYGLDAGKIKGSGSNGKINKVDVLEAIVASGVSKNLNTTVALNGEREKREKMSNLRKTVSKRLVAAKNETAMLTTFNEVNMKPIMDLRTKYKKSFEEKFGVGLGFMSFFTRAVCIALKDWPAVNASIDGDEIIYHHYCDISIAVSAPKGLVVPVVRNAETLSLAEIEAEVKRLATKARDGKLSLEEMTGGTFTITNGGVFGSMMSTPIINPPQSGILGMHNIVERPVAENGNVVIRPMMYVALSYDHRIIDGRESVSFLVRVKQLLENPEMLFDGKNPIEKVLGIS
ncbi:MAG: 2-oxoglutarate dehydrogenase complex dihydrolipoyllysine-residue succinyltransferase [Bacteroidetes bacterium]|nr:2-oxoglutarate dehydrogenase complex dihydrolipoyllysine-residue succinyltransferase [Bacteroidota bacterium]